MQECCLRPLFKFSRNTVGKTARKKLNAWEVHFSNPTLYATLCNSLYLKIQTSVPEGIFEFFLRIR